MCCVVDIYRAASVGVGVQGADTRQFFDSRQMALNSRDVVDAYSSVIVCVSRNYIKQFAIDPFFSSEFIRPGTIKALYRDVRAVPESVFGYVIAPTRNGDILKVIVAGKSVFAYRSRAGRQRNLFYIAV